MPVLLFELELIIFDSVAPPDDIAATLVTSPLVEEVDVMVDELFDDDDCRVSLENGVL